MQILLICICDTLLMIKGKRLCCVLIQDLKLKWSWNESKPACPSVELCLGLETRSSEELAQNWVHSKFQSKVCTMLSCQVIYKNMATTNMNSKHFLDLVAAWNNQFLKVIIFYWEEAINVPKEMWLNHDK